MKENLTFPNTPPETGTMSMCQVAELAELRNRIGQKPLPSDWLRWFLQTLILQPQAAEDPQIKNVLKGIDAVILLHKGFEGHTKL
jgi:hypothetical protein